MIRYTKEISLVALLQPVKGEKIGGRAYALERWKPAEEGYGVKKQTMMKEVSACKILSGNEPLMLVRELRHKQFVFLERADVSGATTWLITVLKAAVRDDVALDQNYDAAVRRSLTWDPDDPIGDVTVSGVNYGRLLQDLRLYQIVRLSEKAMVTSMYDLFVNYLLLPALKLEFSESVVVVLKICTIAKGYIDPSDGTAAVEDTDIQVAYKGAATALYVVTRAFELVAEDAQRSCWSAV